MMAVAAYAVASAGAVLAILLVTRGLETVAAGLLAPVFLLPSIILFVGLAGLALARGWKHVGYLVPALGMMGYLLMLVARDVAGQISEGSGLPAIMAVTFGVAALVAYLLLWGMSQRIASQRAR